MRYPSPLLATLMLSGCCALAVTETAVAQSSIAAGPSDALPVRAVTLFSSGVSYTLREGDVSGDATIPLLFRTTQINDILKSLVLLDENGMVQPAVYAAKDPIGRTLQSFAVDVTQPLTRADLLNRLRGALVSVRVKPLGGAEETIQGQIVGVESKAVSTDSGQTTVEYLTLLGDSGLQSVVLDQVKSIRLLDDRLNREFHEALTLFAGGADDKRRSVTLRFAGQGKRRVRVGYVSEAPLWKISYRLLVGGGGSAGEKADSSNSDKPYLQGWALVENTTDEDWNDVRLSLVSGRPVSFIQDLYQPLYLPRPIVPPDVVASPYPQVAEGNIEEAERETAATPPPPAASPAAPRFNRAERSEAAKPGAGGLGGGGFGAGGLAGPGLPRGLAAEPSRRSAAFRDSVAAQASGEKAGELFQYSIKTPVTLPRQQAAMIPVVAQDVDGDKVSLYNADTAPRFPLNAFRVKNNTGLHLKGGPVTIFDGGVYAGDARMEDVPPGDSRLVTYAVDLAVEGERQNTGSTSTETSVSLKGGVLTVTRRERRENTYNFKNKAETPRTILVEHPVEAGWNLLTPEKAAERTPSRYRFEVIAVPGKTSTLKVVTERPVSQAIALVTSDLNTLSFYATRRESSEALKAGLQEVMRRRRQIQELQAQAASAEAEIKSINEDQERIRKNMTALDKASALYKRYVGQLDAQETRLQALRAQITRLRAAAADADRELRAYVDTLVIN